MERLVEVEVAELRAALVQAGMAREEQALRIASLEAELEVLRQERGREILEKADSNAAKFLSSLKTGTTDPSSPRS